jgi:hypothetical protein
MAVTLEDGLRALREATDLARSIRVELDTEYLQAIGRVESLAANQAGADKTWVWELIDASDRHFARAVRSH